MLSDGKSNGVVIMYCKDGTLYPVGLTEDQVQMLNITLGMALGGKLHIMGKLPMGTVANVWEAKSSV